jgi:hypothetical protein
MVFRVWDTTNNISCLYLYVGVGGSLGVDTHIPVGGTIHGPWTDFTTKGPMLVTEFVGKANFWTVGVSTGILDIFSWSTNRLTISTPRMPTGERDVSVPLEMGPDMVGGAGASSTDGSLSRIGNPKPYNGP